MKYCERRERNTGTTDFFYKENACLEKKNTFLYLFMTQCVAIGLDLYVGATSLLLFL